MSTTPDTTPGDVTAQAPNMLSAFYGLEALPRQANIICPGSGGLAGMPVIFSRELDIDTLQAGDFVVKTKSGQTKSVYCVSPGPAFDPGELRTILLQGNFGSAQDPPVEVTVVGNLLDETGTLNFKGRTIGVIPLEDGPTLILAEIVPRSEWTQKTPGGMFTASQCPDESKQVVRAVWAGGVTGPDNADIGDTERRGYRVRVAGADGTEREVTPFALGDLGDGDNNHDLCLDTSDRALAVSFPAGLVTDPNNDLNPATQIEVGPRAGPTTDPAE